MNTQLIVLLIFPIVIVLIGWWAIWVYRTYCSHPSPPRWLRAMETVRCYLADESPAVRPDLWRNNKTAAVYAVEKIVVNATNAQDGQLMVLYRMLDEPAEFFVRDIIEFNEKFIPINEH